MTPEERYEQVRSAFVDRPGISEGRMFSTEGLKYGTKFFVALTRGEHLLVKLPEDRITELLLSGAGLPFATGTRAPMREWALIPLDSGASWQAIAEEALHFAQKLSR